MSTDRGNRRIDAFPYRYGGESLGFDYVEYEVKDGSSGSLGDTTSLDLSEEGPWESATLTVKVKVGSTTLTDVFPSDPPCDGALVVVGYCPTNHHRFESVVASDPLSPGKYTGTVDLSYEDLRGRVELTPLLVRASKIDQSLSGPTASEYAQRMGQKLAHGETGAVDVDDPVGGKSKDLPAIPRSFSDAPFPADDGNMWYLDLRDAAKPKLYVNTDHGFVESLFKDEGQHGRGRVRQLVVDLLGTEIMTQFVVEAAELYVVHGEMRHPWQERMLTEVCDDLFGEKSPDDVEEMLEPGTLSDTINQVATAVQRRRAPHEALERVLELSL